MNNYHTQLDKRGDMLNEIAVNNHLVNSQMQNFQGTPVNSNHADEIELSDHMIEPPKKEIVLEPSKKSQEINKQIEDLKRNNPTTIKKQPVKYAPKKKKSNSTVNYFIIPILLLIAFVVLVHPRSSKLFGKYLPPLDKLSGMFVRGLILAILYVVVFFVTSKN